MADEKNEASVAIKYERTETFVSSYANSVLFEGSAWDLKLIFGQLDQSVTPNVVRQHLAVTIPWPQAKLALFWLRAQVEMAEATVNAKIPLRKDLLPQELPRLAPEQANEGEVNWFRDWYDKAREEFLKTV